MNERKQLVIILVFIAIIGAIGFLIMQAKMPITDVAYVNNYKADFYLNGTLTEKIDYIVKVPDTYRMLFRNLVAPLVYEDSSANNNNSNNIDNSGTKNNPYF